MLEYRVYCLDLNGMSVEVQALSASTDEDALRQASALPGLRQCEVWRGNRLVGKLTDFVAVNDKPSTGAAFSM